MAKVKGGGGNTKTSFGKRKRLFETQEESDQRKKINRDCIAKQRQTETEEQGAKRKLVLAEADDDEEEADDEDESDGAASEAHGPASRKRRSKGKAVRKSFTEQDFATTIAQENYQLQQAMLLSQTGDNSSG